MLPEARKEGLVVQELADETLVYDLERHYAYCLNRTAALVWKYCDGQTTVAHIVRILRKELKIPANQEVVWLALKRLERAHLLREPVRWPNDVARYSRRELMRRLGKLGVVGGTSALLPMVHSIIVPTAAQGGTSVTPTQCNRFFTPPYCPGLPCTGAPGLRCIQKGNICKCAVP